MSGINRQSDEIDIYTDSLYDNDYHDKRNKMDNVKEAAIARYKDSIYTGSIFREIDNREIDFKELYKRQYQKNKSKYNRLLKIYNRSRNSANLNTYQNRY